MSGDLWHQSALLRKQSGRVPAALVASLAGLCALPDWALSFEGKDYGPVAMRSLADLVHSPYAAIAGGVLVVVGGLMLLLIKSKGIAQRIVATLFGCGWTLLCLHSVSYVQHNPPQVLKHAAEVSDQ